MGFDDTRRRLETYPTYTAICQAAEALGGEAGSLIGRLPEGSAHTPIRQVMPCVFEVHQSTDPARSRQG